MPQPHRFELDEATGGPTTMPRLRCTDVPSVYRAVRPTGPRPADLRVRDLRLLRRGDRKISLRCLQRCANLGWKRHKRRPLAQAN